MKQAGDLFLARVGPWVFIFLVIATLIVSVAMPVQVADRRNDTCRDFGYDGHFILGNQDMVVCYQIGQHGVADSDEDEAEEKVRCGLSTFALWLAHGTRKRCGQCGAVLKLQGNGWVVEETDGKDAA